MTRFTKIVYLILILLLSFMRRPGQRSVSRFRWLPLHMHRLLLQQHWIGFLGDAWHLRGAGQVGQQNVPGTSAAPGNSLTLNNVRQGIPSLDAKSIWASSPVYINQVVCPGFSAITGKMPCIISRPGMESLNERDKHNYHPERSRRMTGKWYAALRFRFQRHTSITVILSGVEGWFPAQEGASTPLSVTCPDCMKIDWSNHE